MRVIINADDFGLNATVNREIERCIREGLITSTTIMAAGEAFDEAVEISKRYPQISFGVHLTLDELSSLTKSPVLHKYGMTDEQGIFIKGGLFRVAKWTSELTTAIRLELEAQIERIVAAGKVPSHFDGHHHCHTIRELHQIMVELSRKYGVNRVRVPLDYRSLHMIINHVTPVNPLIVGIKNSPSDDHSHTIEKPSIYRRVIHNISMFQNDCFFKKHFRTVDYCCSVSSFKKNEDYFQRRMCDRIFELMCHPGHPNYQQETLLLNSLAHYSRISYLNL